MCGVVGELDRSGAAVDPAVLDAMLDAVAHRGPDDRGTWSARNVGLGHVRLSIVDMSDRGHQPFETEGGRSILCFNGEIHNHRALRDELAREGVRFRGESDTEVAAYAMERWGPERAVRAFDGMFGLAFLCPASGELWLARDRSGIKPMYVHDSGDHLIFGSEVKALLAHPRVSTRPDMRALTTQMIDRRLEGEWTPFEGIRSLRPGTLVAHRAGTRETIQFFDPVRDLDVERLIGAGREPFDVHAHAFEEAFKRSVPSHMVSDEPVATLCSGGVDSSLVTALAVAHDKRTASYVIDIEGAEVRERARAERVCEWLGSELRVVPLDDEEFLRLWPRAVLHNEEPCYYPQNVAVMALARAVRRDGVKVLLAGDGADELFGGYPWQADAFRLWNDRGRPLPWPLRDRRVQACIRRLYVRTRGPRGVLSRSLLYDPEVPRWPQDSVTADLAVGGGAAPSRRRALHEKLGALPPGDAGFLIRCVDDYCLHLGTSLRSEDKMAMASSVEMRFPFLANAVLDLAMHLPRKARWNGRVTKRPVKALAAHHLPEDVVHAPKRGFEVDRSVWQPTFDLIAGGRIEALFEWPRTAVAELREATRSDPLLAFQLVSMELWARIFLEGESTERLADALVATARPTG